MAKRPERTRRPKGGRDIRVPPLRRPAAIQPSTSTVSIQLAREQAGGMVGSGGEDTGPDNRLRDDDERNKLR